MLTQYKHQTSCEADNCQCGYGSNAFDGVKGYAFRCQDPKCDRDFSYRCVSMWDVCSHGHKSLNIIIPPTYRTIMSKTRESCLSIAYSSSKVGVPKRYGTGIFKDMLCNGCNTIMDNNRYMGHCTSCFNDYCDNCIALNMNNNNIILNTNTLYNGTLVKWKETNYNHIHDIVIMYDIFVGCWICGNKINLVTSSIQFKTPVFYMCTHEDCTRYEFKWRVCSDCHTKNPNHKHPEYVRPIQFK